MTFVDLYHPALGNVHVQADSSAVSLYEAHGWVLSGGGGPTPDPIDLTPALGDLRYVQLGDRTTFLPFWKAAEAVTTGTVRVDSTGHLITANSNRTTRGSYDATEQAAWTVVSGGGGGGGAITSVAGRTGVVVLTSADLTDSTVTGRALVAAADAPTARTALGLGSAATQPSSAFDAAGAGTTAAAARVPLLVPTATKTATYTAAVGDLAMMNVAGGATTLTLPTAPADKSQVGYRAIGASVAVPLTVNRGGSTDTIGTTGATSASVPLADETLVYQYDAANTRWLAVANVKTKASLDVTYAAYAKTAQLRWNARRQANYERDNALPFTVFVDSVNGSDANTGASPAQAWATLGKLTTATIAYGARIGLARGSTFSGAFTVPAPTGTGSATNRVVFGAYGVGNAPKITGGVFTVQQPYIDVQDIRFTVTSSGYSLFVFNATAGVMIDNRVKRCELDNNTNSGGLIMGTIGGLVEDCYFHDIWNNVEYPSGNGYAALFTTGTDSTEVRYNVVKLCYKGLSAGNTHRDLSIHHNVVIKCRVNGIDMGGGGVVGHAPKIVNNFVWHNPTTPNGHGIDTQSSSVGPYWRNNVVYSDYNGASGNVELYCIDQTTYSSVDVDYNLGFIAPTAANVNYGKLGATEYTTLSAFQTALAGTSYAGKEAHSISADPLIADLTNGYYVPLPGSPAIDAGVPVGGVTDLAGFLGAAPDLGALEVG